MLDKCPSCQSLSKKWNEGAVHLGVPKYQRAAYCKNCGQLYPWTVEAIASSAMLIEEDDDLNPELRERAIESLPDIIAETPRTGLAISRVKKVLASAGRFTADSLRQFAIDFGCELDGVVNKSVI